MKFKKIYFCLFFLTFIFFLFLPRSSQALVFYITQINKDCVNSVAKANIFWEYDGTTTVFSVQRKFSTEPESSWAQVGTTTKKFYFDSPLISDKSYNYRIKVFNNDYTAAVNFPAAHCPPTLNRATSTCQVLGPRISLSWIGVSGDLDFYQIWRSTGSMPVSIGTTDDTFYNDQNNLEGTAEYTYFIEARWMDGNSSSSLEVSEPAPACPPILNFATSCEMATSPGGPVVNLSWNQLLGVEHYQVERKLPGESDFSFRATTTATNHTDKLAQTFNNYGQPGTISYRATSIWLNHQPVPSSPASFNNSPCPPFLTVQDNCQPRQMRLEWTKTLLALRYNIYRATGTTGIYTLKHQTADASVISWQDGLPEEDCPSGICSFTYKVEAVRSFGNLFSNEFYEDIDCNTIHKPLPPPHMATPTASCNQGDSEINLSWSPSNDIIYYEIERNGVTTTSVINTFFIDNDVSIDTNYTYRIIAVGQGGTSTMSDNSFTIKSVNCNPPSSLNLVLVNGCDMGSSYVNLLWSTTTNTLSYEIYKGISSDNLYFYIGGLSPGTTSFRDYVTSSIDIYYKVRAIPPEGVSYTESNIVPIYTSDCLPVAPILYLYNNCSGYQPQVDLSWNQTTEDNTDYYEVFRYDFSTSVAIYRTENQSTKNWSDIGVAPETSYSYKVEAVGPAGRTTTGYWPITTWYCAPPDQFTLNAPEIACHNFGPDSPYPWATLSWTPSAHALYYEINRHSYNNGTIIGTTTIATTTVVSPIQDRGWGKALSFDGSANSYIDFASSASLNNLSELSIEFWVKAPPDHNTSYGVLGTTQNYDSDGFNFYFRGTEFPNTRLDFHVNGTFIRFGDYVENKWYHIIATYKSAPSSQMKLWIDGQFLTSQGGQGDIIINSIPLVIGKYATATSNSFKGLLDEVRIYAKVLPTSTVQKHYLGDYSGDLADCGGDCDLRALWHFDESTSTIVSDASNNNNKGRIKSLTNVVWVDNGLQFDKKYSWQAIARSRGFESYYSTETVPLVLSVCPPSKPGLYLERFCQGTSPGIQLEWSYSLNATAYKIYGTNSVLLKTVLPTDPEYTSRIWSETGLNTGQQYYYRIQASGTNAITYSDWRNIPAPSCTAPPQPINVQAAYSCNGPYPRVSLTWSSSTGADSYEIFRGKFSVGSATSNSYIDDAAVVNKDFYYIVVAVNLGGQSSSSDPVFIHTDWCPAVKPTVGSVAYCTSSGTINEINWKDESYPSNNFYRIYRNQTGSGPFPSDRIATITDPFNFYHALDFDGARGSTTLPTSSLTNGKSEVTLEFWIRPDSWLSSKTIWDECAGPSSNYWQFSVNTSYWFTRDTSTGYNGSRNNDLVMPSGSNIKIKQWNYLTFVYSVASSTKAIYLNGQLFNSTGNSIDQLTSERSFAALGKSCDSAYGYFNGMLDKVKLYYRALSLNEISEHYQGIYNNETGLQSSWQFNEAAGGNFLLVGGVVFDTASSTAVNDARVSSVGIVSTRGLTSVDGMKYIDKDPNLQKNQDYYYWVETLSRDGSASTSNSDRITTWRCQMTPDVPFITSASTSCYDVHKVQNTISWATSDNISIASNIYRSSALGSDVFYARSSSFRDRGSSALAFDGTSNSQVLAYSTSIDNLEAFSVEVWFYQPAGESRNQVIVSNDFFGLRTSGFSINTDYPDDLTLCSNPSVPAGYCPSDFIGGPSDYTQNAWHHLVGTYDSNEKIDNLKLYFDGQLVNWSNFSGILDNDYNGPIKTSTLSGSATTYFEGMLDDLRMYKRALRPEEILERFQEGKYQNEKDLLAVWHMDEDSNFFPTPDDSGYLSHGKIRGANLIDQGALGKAFKFDVGGTINCGTNSILAPSNVYSAEAWIKPGTNGVDNRYILGKYIDSTTDSGYRIQIALNPLLENKVYYYVAVNGNLMVAYKSYKYPIDNNWHHVAHTAQQLGGVVIHRAYFDGLEIGSTTVAGTITPSSNNFKIGGNNFDGSIDEVIIYNRVLSPAEIQAHYNKNYAGFDDRVIGLWHLDEGEPLKLYDDSGYRTYGSIGAATDWVATSASILYNPHPVEQTTYTYGVTASGINTESASDTEIFTSNYCGAWVNWATITPRCVGNSSEIYLDWNAGGAVGYDILRDGALYVQGYYPTTSYADLQVQSGITYLYQIRAWGPTGEEVLSSVETSSAPACVDVPLKPLLTVNSGCNEDTNLMHLQWLEDLSGKTLSYDVFKGDGICSLLEDDDFYSIFTGLPSSAIFYDDEFLPAGFDYCYKLKAVGSGPNNFTWSDPAGSTTENCVILEPRPRPDLITNFAQAFFINTTTLYTAVSLSWTDCQNEDYYEIWRSTDGINFFYHDTTVLDQDDYLDIIDVEEDTTYYYEIKAINNNGSIYSDPKWITVPIAKPGPFELNGAWVNNGVDILLKWTTSSSSVKGGQVQYQIESNETEIFSTHIVDDFTVYATSLEYIDENVNTGRPYYRIAAKNVSGITYSNVIKIDFSLSPFWKEIIPW